MAKIQACRICFAQDTRMHSINNTELQDFYEFNTYKSINALNGMLSMVCHICYHILKKSHDFIKRAIESDAALQQLYQDGTQITNNSFAEIHRKLSFVKLTQSPIKHTWVESEISLQYADYEEERRTIKVERDEKNLNYDGIDPSKTGLFELTTYDYLINTGTESDHGEISDNVYLENFQRKHCASGSGVQAPKDIINRQKTCNSEKAKPIRKNARMKLTTSPKQFTALIEFMEKHGEISPPGFNKHVNAQMHGKWKELTSLLNSKGRPGMERTMQNWRMVWASWKAKVKNKCKLLQCNKINIQRLSLVDRRLAKFLGLNVASLRAQKKDLNTLTKREEPITSKYKIEIDIDDTNEIDPIEDPIDNNCSIKTERELIKVEIVEEDSDDEINLVQNTFKHESDGTENMIQLPQIMSEKIEPSWNKARMRLRSTPAQFLAMVKFMERHGDISNRHDVRIMGMEAKWNKLASILNGIGKAAGVERTPDKWKTVWRDWKINVTKKYKALQRNQAVPGRVHLPKLTNLDERVVNIIGLKGGNAKQESISSLPTQSTKNDIMTPKSGSNKSPEQKIKQERVDVDNVSIELENELIPCTYCDENINKQNLEEHLKMHTGDKPYLCAYCDKRFTQKVFLKRHTTRIHKQSNMRNGEQFYQCSCGKYFTQSYLQKHYSCAHCNVCHCNRRKIIRHLKKHTAIPCEHCGVKIQGGWLKTHIKIMHINKEKRKIVCEYCGNSFSSQNALKVHLLIHTGEKPFACKYCGKTFRHESSVTKHERQHTGEKPYTCEVCGIKVSRSSNLHAHMRIHTGEKPFACNQCEAKFKRKRSLLSHLRSHTGEKPYSCEKCGQNFKEQKNLKRHLVKNKCP